MHVLPVQPNVAPGMPVKVTVIVPDGVTGWIIK